MAKRTSGTRSAVIRCPNCGEDYSVTYKRCPFCDEKAAEEKRDPERPEEETEGEGRSARGGRRLAGSRRGNDWTPLRIVSTVVPLAIIAAAIWIVVTQIMPLVNRGDMDQPPASPPPVTTTQGVEETPPAPSESAQPGETTPPEETVPPEETAPATPTVSPEPTVPVGQTATGFTLNREDFTMNDSYPDPVRLTVTFQPDGSTGSITWTSSDPEVASVDESGLVTHGTKNGSATITATMGDGTTRTCTVRCSFTNPGSASSSSSASTGALSLSRTDFTLMKKGDKYQLKVSGTSSTPTWHIGNTAVATISGDGTVTAVGRGNTTITCTVDGKTLECIVRCDF